MADEHRDTGAGWSGDSPPGTPRVTAPDEERDAAGSSRRVSVADATIAVLLALLGFALGVQLQNRNTDAELAGARPEDLVRILSDLDARHERLRGEVEDLEASR